MPQKLDRFKILQDIDKLLYPIREDSIRTGLSPRARTLTASEEALNRLVDTGEMTPDKRDSITGGLLKFATPKEPSEKELGITGLLGAGEITKPQADSMRAGLDIGEEKTKWAWWTDPEFLKSPGGMEYFRKMIGEKTLLEQYDKWSNVIKNISPLGLRRDISVLSEGDREIYTTATNEMRRLSKLIRKETTPKKADTLKEWFEPR